MDREVFERLQTALLNARIAQSAYDEALLELELLKTNAEDTQSTVAALLMLMNQPT